MKVLLINQGDLNSGAGYAALQLHRSLIQLGVKSILLTEYDTTQAFVPNIIKFGPFHSRKLSKAMNLTKVLFNHTQLKNLNGYMKKPIRKDFKVAVDSLSVDIIHIQWTNNIELLNFLSQKKNVFFSIRDHWIMTGGCAYPENCPNFLQHCDTCPKTQKFETYRHRQSKYETIKNGAVHLLTLGSGTYKALKRLMPGVPLSIVGNNIRDEFFEIGVTEDIDELKTKLGLDPRKKYILLGGVNLRNQHKGYDKLASQLKYFPSLNIILFGEGCDKFNKDYNLNAICFGFISDIKILREVYRCSSVYLFASTSETFGKTVFEAASQNCVPIYFNDTQTSSLLREHLPEMSVEAGDFHAMCDFGMKLIKNEIPRPTKTKLKSIAKIADPLRNAKLILDKYNDCSK